MLSDSSTIRDKNCVRLPLLSGPLSILIWMRLVSAFSRWIMVRRAVADGRDRKSTRLNSSHEWSSYAVFCLKKKIGQLGELERRRTTELRRDIGGALVAYVPSRAARPRQLEQQRLERRRLRRADVWRRTRGT